MSIKRKEAAAVRIHQRRKGMRALAALLILMAAAPAIMSCGGSKDVSDSAGGDGGVKSGGRTVLLVLPQSDFQDQEYSTVRDVLTGGGCQVLVATAEHKVASGVSGTMVTPDMTLGEAKAADYIAVVFIGGPGAESLYKSNEAHRLAVEAVEKNRVLGAICLAPVILARAGVLKGKRATVYSAASRELTSAGAEYTGASVEKDGKIITADGPQSSQAFAQAILDALP
jgi:protease I